MLHGRFKILAVLAVILVLGAWTAMAGSLVDQRAVLSGTVQSVVAVGASVSEGTELVRVSTLTGSGTAARATHNGVVKEVLVKVGSKIKNGDVVVRLAEQ